jgi:hypothetical protein
VADDDNDDDGGISGRGGHNDWDAALRKTNATAALLLSTTQYSRMLQSVPMFVVYPTMQELQTYDEVDRAGHMLCMRRTSAARYKAEHMLARFRANKAFFGGMFYASVGNHCSNDSLLVARSLVQRSETGYFIIPKF